ncbi:hypothetical protein XAPC_4283 [Xanthomonas citri pv. punicae str. LMG 859]|nr:hypothetical protein XAPC_4283 [Xanthomonas citri pv. punicae str. LMG 859]
MLLQPSAHAQGPHVSTPAGVHSQCSGGRCRHAAQLPLRRHRLTGLHLRSAVGLSCNAM